MRVGEKGAAIAEFAFAFVFLAIVLSLSARMAALGIKGGRLLVYLNREIEEMLVENGLPVCLEKLGDGKVYGKIGASDFGHKEIIKTIYLYDGAICR